MTAFFNSCAVRKSFFDFAAKERARRYIVEGTKRSKQDAETPVWPLWRESCIIDYLLLKMI